MSFSNFYNLQQKIGESTFSTVYQASHRLTGKLVAVKIISKKLDEIPFFLRQECPSSNDPGLNLELYIQSVHQEIDIMKSIDHPNIVKLFDYFEDDDAFYFVQELCTRGDLASYIKSNGLSNPREIQQIFLQIVNSVKYLHQSKGIIHCDIKAENILLDDNNVAKLADFGLSIRVNQSTENSYFSNRIRGSPAYIAPEVLQSCRNSPESDIWSLGVLLYFLLVGSLPFEDEEFEGLINSIIEMKPVIPSFLSDDESHLLTQMLNKDPQKRIPIEAIKDSEWCSQEYKVLKHVYRKYRIDTDETFFNSLKPLNLSSLKSSNESHKQSTSMNSFDQFVIDQMVALKIPNCENRNQIILNLKEQKRNDVTATYKILKKMKENDIFSKYMEMNMKSEIPHTRSDIDKYHQHTPIMHFPTPNSARCIRKSASSNAKKTITISSKKCGLPHGFSLATFH